MESHSDQSLDLSRCRLKPFDHQVFGIQKLVDHPYFFLMDSMGVGKSLQTIVAAQILFEQDIIDRVIVIAPASVCDVWYDESLGELEKHLFVDLPAVIERFHSKNRSWLHGPDLPNRMHWVIGNYEYIRMANRLEELLEYCTPKTLLVLDESSACKAWRARQTHACMELRKHCGRVVLLNGTPLANSPLDMFSQCNILHPSILECKGITHFQARYANMGGYVVRTAWGSRPTQIVGWKNLDDLQRRVAPYALRRLTKDCLDLPPVLPPVTLTATLSNATWKLYTQMRDEMVAWLSDATVSVAAQTITKVLRLSQITSGFIGGLEPEIWKDIQEGRPDFLPLPELTDPSRGPVQEIGREKLDVLLEWLDEQLIADPNLKLLVWCRFIPELDRMLQAFRERYPQATLGCIAGRALLGKTTREERSEALRLLDPRTAPAGPALVGGTYGTGSLGLNLTACHTQIKISTDYSHFKSVQTDARIDRPGQVHPISQFNIVAVGPKGQSTIDHIIVRALRDKENVANYTTSVWVQLLTRE